MSSRDFLIHARIEAYSCQPTDSDKKLKNFIDEKYPTVIELPSSVESNSQDSSRKTLVYLRSTLNAAFPGCLGWFRLKLKVFLASCLG